MQIHASIFNGFCLLQGINIERTQASSPILSGVTFLIPSFTFPTCTVASQYVQPAQNFRGLFLLQLHVKKVRGWMGNTTGIGIFFTKKRQWAAIVSFFLNCSSSVLHLFGVIQVEEAQQYEKDVSLPTM